MLINVFNNNLKKIKNGMFWHPIEINFIFYFMNNIQLIFGIFQLYFLTY